MTDTTREAVARARETLENVKSAILQADIDIICDTLWMPTEVSPAETVVDYIDAALAALRPAQDAPCQCGELREATANYVRCVKDPGLSAYISENGRHGKSPWAELLDALAATAPRSGESFPEPLKITYRNWRGETAERKIIPKSVRFGTSEWHPEPGWLLLAFDVEKQADREFEFAGIER